MSYKSQFGYIMDLLEITGKEVSKGISVDRTLVSKWKNNARPLKQKNPHFSNVVKVLIEYNTERKDAILERFFREVYPNIDRNEPDYLFTCLNVWLQGNDLGYFHSFNDWRKSKDALYTTNIEVFQGNEGKRNAILEFFDYALQLPVGQEIFISDLEQSTWLTEQPGFHNIYHNKIDELAKYGHNITILYNPQVNTTSFDQFDYFRLAKYFTGNVTAYNSSDRRGSGPSLYIIHRHMVMLSMAGDTQDNRYITLYRDPFSIKQMVRLFVKRLERSTQMISTYSSHGTSLKGFTENLLSAIKDGNSSYFLSPLPPFSTIPEVLLQEILSSHEMTDQQMFELMQIHKVNKNLFFNNTTKTQLNEVISKEKLEAALSQEKTRLDDISSIIKKDVYITREQVIQHLTALSDLAEHYENFDITVASYKEIPLLSQSMLWVVKDQMLYSYPLNGDNYFIISDAKFIMNIAIDFIQDILMSNEEAKPLNHYLKGLS